MIVGFLFVSVSVYGFRKSLDYSNSDGWILVTILGAVAALVGVVVPTVTWSSRVVGRTSCRNWATQTGYQTKFAIINWADGGTCLALTSDGHWVPNTQIIINTPAK